MKNKLFALNLALFMIVVSALPVFATGNNKEDILTEQQSYVAQYDKFTLKAETKIEQLQIIEEESNKNESVELYASRSTGYNIVVGGTSFSSAYDAKGNGWEYKSDNNTLILDGYNGSGIKASGDLVIYASGVNEIAGATSTYYGSDGIETTGYLSFNILGGTTTISGGDGYNQGGDGMASNQIVWIDTFSGASLIVTGGDTAKTGGMGGDAIYGPIVLLRGDGFVRATGGDGMSVYSSECAGGCAIIGNEVSVESSCELIGGEGYYAGPGIYFGSYLETGVVNATISCGRGQYYNYAIQCSDGLDWYYNNHTIVSGNESSIKISIRQYTLKLLGNGGNRGTATFESLKAYYPTSYDLSEYVFQRKGYTQIGWSNASGDLVPLSDWYMPNQDTYLCVEWAPNTYKVSYNSNGGSGSMSNSTHTYDIAKNLTNCTFSKKGYTFSGWATTSNGNVVYTNGASVKNLTTTNGDTVTLYAVWEKTTPYTQIKKDANNKYSVELFNSSSGCAVIFATYCIDGRLVELLPYIYEGETIPFTLTKEYDTFKVMVWDSLTSLKPLCESNSTLTTEH
ncbi:MAG: InlB B-repeat-containing protein [Clostridia bacterium]|nr:InlB B-repeat-containing protein [Clostridia bacterium]